jgi:hypothetical protein
VAFKVEKIMLLQPKNWAVFQHYKDRCPPWIKLHRDLLNDRAYMRLPIASKAIAPMLWLLASESKDGVFDGSLDELVFRLHITKKEYQDGIKPLIDNDFFVLVSGVLAERKQSAIPETEGETEKETETDTPEGVSVEVWDSFVKQRKARKAQITERVMKSIREQAKIAGWTLDNALNEIVVRNWQTFKAEWVAVKPNPADRARLTVAPSNEPDPALLKIKQDEKITRPPTPEERAILNSFRRKA